MLLTTVAGVDDEAERARLTATGIPSLVPCRLSGLALRDDANHTWQVVCQTNGRLLPGLENKDAIAELESFLEEAESRASLSLIRCDKETNGPRIPRYFGDLGVGSIIVVPFQTLHHHLGVVLVGRSGAEVFSGEEQFILQTLAHQLAITIENLRLQGALKRHSENLQALVDERTARLRTSEKRQRALLEINNAIISKLDRESLFSSVAGALSKVIAFDRASLSLYDPATDSWEVSALAGRLPTKKFLPTGTKFQHQGSAFQSVLDQRRPRVYHDLEEERTTTEEELLYKEGIRSAVAVPMISSRRAIGTLCIGAVAPGRYCEEDAEFLLEVAGQVALALENMMTYEEIVQLRARLEQENLYLQEEIKTQYKFEEMVGRSAPVKKVMKAIETVAPTEATVLILGETGTGKELVARAVHDLSPRKDKALVKVNCTALPASLIESELFGHEKGAFTGALLRKIGRFELADGGTLFLDEIGDFPIDLQGKLLRVLQEGEFETVGGSKTIRVDVRVIAATNRDLQAAIESGGFRADLYYRLNVFPIEIPPLRERAKDIPLLVNHFVMKQGAKLGKQITRVPQKVMRMLQDYNWPGNIRELSNIIERAVIISRGDQLELGDWLPKSRDSSVGSRVLTLEELEREHILEVLEGARWRVSGNGGAAEVLGLKPTTLEARMKKLRITRKR